MPKVLTSSGTKRGLFARQDFIYDAEHDHYTCPAGAKLTKIHRRADPDPTRSIGARDRILDASHCSNRWALDASPDDYHPILAQHRALDPHHLASRAIPLDRPALLSGQLE